MTDKYGPNSAEVEKLLAKCKSLTPELADALAEAYDKTDDEIWDPAWERCWQIGLGAGLGAGRDFHLDSVQDLDLIDGLVWCAVRDACSALVVRDLISEEDFNTLYSPWKSVMEVGKDEHDFDASSITA